MSKEKKLVALCTSRVYDPAIHGFIKELNERLAAENHSLLVFAINSDIYWEEDRQATEKYVFDIIPYDQVDCVIIMDEKIKSRKIAEKIIRRATRYQVPVVVSDGHYEGATCITFDYGKGFEKVVRHVIEHHGIRNVHMMAGQPDNSFSNERIDVFKKVLAENNIPFEDHMLSYGYFWADPCREAMREILKRERLPEAFICANDIMAINVSEMLIEAGHKVPDEILVTGFDGYDEIYFTSPKITTASCDILLLADATADAALKYLNGEAAEDVQIAPEFIANESCGCPEHMEHPQILLNRFNESFYRHNDDNRVLHQITSNMQTSLSLGEMVSYLESYKTETLLCIVDRNCFDVENNYFLRTDLPELEKDFVLIYDSEHPEDYKQDTLSLPPTAPGHTEDALSVPFRSRMLELAESKYPLIFNALDFMNIPIGFVCYFFRDYTITHYSGTINCTNAISTGIGGYVNLQYQRTLLDKMDEMYRRDSLTGLYNRIGFHNIFKKLRQKKENIDQPVTVIMSDLDGLKYINDHFGHAEGDNAIATVAQALKKACPETALSARFGGDELFSVIIGDCKPEFIMKRIDQYLSEYNDNAGLAYDVQTSCGSVTGILNDQFDITQALKVADDEMYGIKQKKRYNRSRPQ